MVKANLPGGGKSNRQFFAERVLFREEIGFERADVLLDPQTSGGLLVAINSAHADDTLRQLLTCAPAAAIVGRVTPPAGHLIVVR